ncbi:MAG: hypothetical protein AAFN30_07095 [Actinomycetota bacterium]
MNPGSAVHGLQRAVAAVSNRSVALLALIGLAVPSVATLGFWALAARRHQPGDFAAAFALAMIVMMVGRIARLGLAEGLERHLPEAGPATGRVLARAAAITAALAGIGALVFVLGLDIWAPDLDSVRSSLPLALFVVAATVGWAVYQLADTTLASLYPEQEWVWLARASVALGRIGLVLALAALIDNGGEGRIIVSWGVPAVISVLVVGALVGRPLLADGVTTTGGEATGHDGEEALPVSFRRLRAVGHSAWLMASAQWIAIGVLALLALGRLETSSAAHYFVAWLLATVGVATVDGLVETLTGRWVRSDQADDRSLTRALGFNALLAAAVVAVVLGLVQVADRVIGPAYAGALGPARALAFLAIPSAFVTTLSLRLEAEDRTRVVVGVRVLMAVAVVVTGVFLVEPWGVYGLVSAWLAVATAAALGCLAALTVWWWGPRLAGRWAAAADRLAAGAQAARSLAERRALNVQVRDHLSRLYQSMPQWKRESASTVRQTLAVAGHDGRPPLRLELARSSAGTEQLKRRREAVSEINGLASLGPLRNLLPYPIDHGEGPAGAYLVESVVSGERGDTSANAALLRQRVEAVTDAVVELHNETAFTMTFDGDALDHWVTKPLRRLGDSVRIPDADLTMAAGKMLEGLNGLSLSAARIHGSLRMDQARFEQGGPRLTGLLNWEWSEPGPIALDWGVLALSAVMAEERRDLGLVVADLLDEPARLRLHPAFVTAVGDTVPPPVLVLMAWLQHTRPVVVDAGTRGLSRFWEARNVRPVLARLGAGLDR